MSHLATQQQALLAALFDWPPDDAINNLAAYAYTASARGIKAYQTNGHELAIRALNAAYPVLAQLLGEESFASLARALWHAQPPIRGDVGQWGDGLADWVRSSSQLQDHPYLGDVAALEWALHSATTAPDATVDAPSFALLATHDPADLLLQLAPGCKTLLSCWPVASIYAAHSTHDGSFDTARARLQAGTHECAVVWRTGLIPSVRQTSALEHALLNALLTNNTLGAALDALPLSATPADEGTEWDITNWLTQAVQSGLLLGVQRLIR